VTVADAQVLARIYDHLKAGGEIRLDDRRRFGIEPRGHESVIDALVRQHDVLLRGSGSMVPAGTPLGVSRSTGWVLATTHGGIAILQALFSNETPRHLDKWTFPLNITAATPLVVKVANPRPGFQRQRGFVYVISDRSGFKNQPVPSWQWITIRTDKRVDGRIEVERRDFEYPVETVSRL
jgi:hypothetical protein